MWAVILCIRSDRIVDPEITEKKQFDILWLVNCGLITAAAAFMRFFELGLKPFHHDEGVNGWFLTNLFRSGTYTYDPTNYHGPTLYYIALPFAQLFGLETIPARSSVAIFGVLMVVLVFFLRKYIGKTGSLCAGLFLAFSPGMVFISRYFIHEIFFVFLALALVVSILYFIDRKRVGPFAVAWTVLLFVVCFLPPVLRLATKIADGNSTTLWSLRIGVTILEAILIGSVIFMLIKWRDGRPIYLILASACVALMFATKETAFITLGTMLIAIGCVWIYQKINKPTPSDDESETISFAAFGEALGIGADRWLLIVAVAVTFIYVFILFFSSFFTYPEGVNRAFEAYAAWANTGRKDHVYKYLEYYDWGKNFEGPIMLLSVLGTAIAFIKARHKVAMFTGLWAVGLFAAYSIIPYKTPWLALSFLLPMCIVAGYGIDQLFRSSSVAPKIVAGVLAAASVGFLAYRSYDLAFVHYDDNSKTYVYAHTYRSFLDMIREIDHYAEKSGKGRDAAIDIVSPDYWPMVWYVKDYPNAVFHGMMIEPKRSEIVIAKKDAQDEEIIRKYSADYRLVGIFPLRPGVDLVMLVRKDLAGPDAKELYQIERE